MKVPAISKLFRTFVFGVLVALASAETAFAHVALDAPNGGETLTAGTDYTITWHVVIGHNTLNWDLWYSTTGVMGPWVPIELNLPPGDISTGAVHTYEWTVPDAASDQVRVRVRQDNTTSDYLDISDNDLTIVTGLFLDGFEGGDTSEWTSTTPATP